MLWHGQIGSKSSKALGRFAYTAAQAIARTLTRKLYMVWPDSLVVGLGTFISVALPSAGHVD